MRPAERCGGRGQAPGAAGQTRDDADILAERDAGSKQAPDLGNCIHCGQHIRLVGGATTCPTCAAWRRWYVAHRIASGYLREVGR